MKNVVAAVVEPVGRKANWSQKFKVESGIEKLG